MVGRGPPVTSAPTCRTSPAGTSTGYRKRTCPRFDTAPPRANPETRPSTTRTSARLMLSHPPPVDLAWAVKYRARGLVGGGFRVVDRPGQLNRVARALERAEKGGPVSKPARSRHCVWGASARCHCPAGGRE